MDNSVFGFVFILLYLAIVAIAIVGYWKLFEKAHKPGWASLIPIYNIIVLFEIIGRPAWHLILIFIPFVNIYIVITMIIGLCKSFGKSDTGSYLLAIFFGFVYIPYLGFSGDVKYVGPQQA